MNAVLNRMLHAPLPRVERGEGVWLWDSEGNKYLDAVSGGAAVSCLGHGNRRVEAAMVAQLSKVAYVHGSFFTSHPAEELAALLLADAPEGMTRVLFSSGGSESNEAALKLVRQYWLERGQPDKSRVIARRQSYHGATLGALAVSGNPGRRSTYSPYLFDVHFIEPCYSYRLRRSDESESDYGVRAADELEKAILGLGAESVAAFIAEPVVGATLGCVPAAQGYLRRIQDICKKYDVLLVLDEIMCGSGRGGAAYTSTLHGVSPDILTVAKGLGGGFQPIGATLVSDRVVQALEQGSGVLKHGLTYMGHPVACAAALAVQTVLREIDAFTNVRRQGAYLQQQLNSVLSDHPNVGDIRGQGLFVGVELVAERSTKETFPAHLQLHARIKNAALQAGLMVYPGGGTVDGVNGDHVVFAPAYTVTESEIDQIVERFTGVLSLAIDTCKKGM